MQNGLSMRLLYGDCIDEMRRLPSMSVDMVLADIPYGTTRCAWDEVIPLDEMWEQVWRVTKLDAAVVLTAQTPFDKVLGASCLKLLRYEWIWEKGNATGHLNAKRMPMKSHENVLVFYRRLPTYNPQKTRGHVRKVSFRKSTDSCCYNAADKPTFYDSTERFPRSVLKFGSDKQKERKLHPTQKPVALMEYLINTYSNPRDVVLDFAMGSGTTGVACKNTGRSFIGIDNNKEYFETSLRRLA